MFLVGFLWSDGPRGWSKHCSRDIQRHVAINIKAAGTVYKTADMFVTWSLEVQNGHKMHGCTGSSNIHGEHNYLRLAEQQHSARMNPVRLWTLLQESCCPFTVNQGLFKKCKSLSWYFQVNISFAVRISVLRLYFCT